MIVTKVEVGPLRTNCYIVYNDKVCLIFDPGTKDYEELDKILKKTNDKEVIVIATHGHYDHIIGMNKIQAEKYLISESDFKNIIQLNQGFFKQNPLEEIKSKIEFLREKEYTFGNITFKALETRGHTKGSFCFMFEDFIITGDTLFKGTFGRTDLFSGNIDEMKHSLKKLAELDPKLTILPGHGSPSVLINEIPWIRELD